MSSLMGAINPMHLQTVALCILVNIENGEKFVPVQVGEFLSCLPNWSKYAKII